MSALSLLIIFFLLPALVVISKNVLWFVYFWQIKEYRIDRVVSYYRFDREYKPKERFEFISKILLVGASVILLLVPFGQLLILIPILTYVLYVIAFQNAVRSIISKGLTRPRIKSIRNILLLTGSFSTAAIALLIGYLIFNNNQQVAANLPELFGGVFSDLTPSQSYAIAYAAYVLVFASIFALLLDLLTFLIVTVFVSLTEPLSQYRRQRLIKKASSIIKRNKTLRIVAVTGSYGKTTTKEMLYQILSKHFKTVKTPENKNTEVGVAMTIIDSIKQDTEVFIAEMGAYRKGEIYNSTKIAPPDISIVTAVGDQHLSIFGSVENIFHAKYEIVEGLKAEGIAVLNGNNEYCLRMAERTEHDSILYFSVNDQIVSTTDVEPEKDSSKKFPRDNHAYAKNIKVSTNGITFDFVYGRKTHKIKTDLRALHDISNLMAAMIASIKLGLSSDLVVKTVNDINIEVPYWNVREGVSGTILIDDGYNANPVGFMEALKYLANYQTTGKRYVVTEGFIELGRSKESRYQEMAEQIVRCADVLVTSDKYLWSVVADIDLEFNAIYTESAKFFTGILLENLVDGDVVLLEGSLPASVLREISE